MATLLLTKNDYNTNKNPRLPICLCIDTSDNIRRSLLPEIQNLINSLKNFILSDSEYQSKIQLCIICYSADIKVISDFISVTNDSNFILEESKGEPNLNNAIAKCINLLNSQLLTYAEKGIRFYLPELLILSSGKTSTDITEISERLCRAQSEKKLCVMPFIVGEESGEQLSSLTDDRVVYSNVNDFGLLFSCLKNSIEQLSSSSAAACESLKTQTSGWEDFNKKR